MKKLYMLLSLTFVSYFAKAQQNWVELKNNPNANFYDIQKAFNEYWKDKDINEPGNGYKPFKRWEYFVEPRVYPSGDLSLLAKTGENFQAYLDGYTVNSINSNSKFESNNQIASSTWTAIGPMGAMTGSANNGLPRKAGRDNFITFHPTNINTFWVGAPAGGLWKTMDNGATWTTNTNSLGVIGATDLAIDPSNTNIMYLATGDGYAGDTRSIGVLKSTDGGATWNTTGLNYNVSANFLIRRLIIHPTNPQILIAATNGGVYRTNNAAASWTLETSNMNTYDVEFKPGDPNTVYASTNSSFWLSTNGGDTFTQISSGIPTSGSARLNIAVTAADVNYVYVIRSNSSNGFGGLYRSVNSGTSFSVMSTTPDILANSCAGTSGGGQGWYDLAIAVSPTNKDIVVVGGVNHWRSTNGGTNWTCIGCWNSTVANPPYVHADVHDLDYRSDGILYSTNDGGVYYHTGTSWTDITANRNIAQIYRIGLSALSPARWMTGHQDNGSNLYTGTQYLARYAGDGMDCFIDRTNDNNLFASTPNGGYVKSTNGGSTWSSATSGLSGGTYWVSPWKQDPQVANTIYGSRNNLWRSTNQGTSWTQLAAIPGNTSQGVYEFAVAPSNNQVIYVIHGSTGVYKTTNGGTSWTAVNSGLPVGVVQIEYIAIKSTDPNTAWVVCSGYSAANKVFKTTNGGTSWTNITNTLPNIPANTIVYDPNGANDMVYIGMDVGVYYRDNLSANWTLYNAGLPNVPISDMEISPASPTKIRAATYGRGVWEVDVVTLAAPVTSYTVASPNLCTNTNLQFNDNSTNNPSSWSWSVTPSANVTITTSSSQNPSINFGTAGTYVVAMQASNTAGPGTIYTQTLTIAASPTVNLSATSQTICAGSAATITASGATTYSWSNGGGTGTSAVYSPTATTVYSVTGTSGACTNMKTSTVVANALPNVVVTGSTSICLGNSATLTVSGGVSYTWTSPPSNSTSIIVTPASTNVYTVTGTGANTCKKVTLHTVTVTPTPTVNLSVTSQTICAGYSASITASGATSYSWSNGGGTGATAVYSPTATTVYSVTGTSGVCSNMKTTTVVTNPAPNVLISGASTVCAGNTATLTASGAVTYTWTNPSSNAVSIVVNPTATTIYTVVGTGTNSCNKTTVHTVNAIALPSINAAASTTLVCLGETGTLTASGGVSYTWNPGSLTGSSIIIGPSANTIYTVTGVNASGCANTSTINIVVTSCTGLVNINGFNVNYHVFPNPTSKNVTLQINTSNEIAIAVEVIDMNGKLIDVKNLNFSSKSNSQQIDLSGVSNGVYYLKLKPEVGEVKMIKLLKD